MRFPENITFGSRNVIGTPPGINLGCLAETVALTMAGITRNYSIGEKPPLADALNLFALATEHGFSLAPRSGGDARASLKPPTIDDGVTL